MRGWVAFAIAAAPVAQAQQAPATPIPGVSTQQFPARPGPALPSVPKPAVQEPVDLAPPPSARFPAAWYPPENDWTAMFAPITRFPYSATMVQTDSLPAADGHPAISSEIRTGQYRDSAGRTRTEQLLPGRGRSGEETARREVEVVDAVAHCTFRWVEPWTGLGEPSATVRCIGRRARLNPPVYEKIAQLAVTQTAADRTEQAERWTYRPLGTKQIAGMEAYGVRRTRFTAAAPNPGFSVDFWWSPRLQELVLMAPPAPVFGFPSFALQEIKPGEPDARLFYPPAGYRIVRDDAPAK